MDIEFIDTDKLREIGNNILDEANNYKNSIDFLNNRINNINSKTFEWVGIGSYDFIDKFNFDLKMYNDIYIFIKEYGEFLINCSNIIENYFKKVIYD